MSIPLTCALILLCFVFEGFFSGSEIALVSADRLKLQSDADAGKRGAKLALKMLERPTFTLGACLVGTNLCTIAAATLATGMVARWTGAPAWLPVVIVWPLTLTLGEMLPKAVYQHHADRLVQVVVFPLRVVSVIFSPFLWVVDGVERLLGGKRSDDGQTYTRQELRLLLETTRAPNLTADDRQLIRRVFAFTEATVEDAMVPLIEVVAVPRTTRVADAARRMVETGHSRLPVYDGRVDRIGGVVLHHDLLTTDDWDAPISTVARDATFVPETKRADELLLEMRRQRQRLAVVVDEYGGAVGIITAEDILEEIVGEIEDESDRAKPLVRRVGEREWLASGRAEREHLHAECALALPDGDFETLAGFVLSRLGRVPTAGEGLREGPFVLTVAKASDRAVLEVKVRREHR